MSGKTKKAAKERKRAEKQARRAEKAARKADRAASSPVGATFGATVLDGIAEEPRLTVAALATLGTGLVTHRSDLIRGGARMLAVHVAAIAMTRTIGSRLGGFGAAPATGDHAADPASAPPAGDTAGEGGDLDVVLHRQAGAALDGLIGWLAEALVSIAFDRIEPAVERRWARPHAAEPARTA